MSSFSAYELWFKQIIFELDSVRAKFNSEVRILTEVYKQVEKIQPTAGSEMKPLT
jgi:hypothetical protein